MGRPAQSWLRDTGRADLGPPRCYRCSVNSANGIYRDVPSLDIETPAAGVTFSLDFERAAATNSLVWETLGLITQNVPTRLCATIIANKHLRNNLRLHQYAIVRVSLSPQSASCKLFLECFPVTLL